MQCSFIIPPVESGGELLGNRESVCGNIEMG